MRKIICIKSLAVLLGVGLPVVNAMAGEITSSSAIGSESGFGVVSYNTGINVDEFILFGRASSGADYITSAGASHIAAGIAGDGTAINNNAYDATSYSWTGGAPTLTGTYNIESCQATANPNGFGVTPYTYAAINVSAPSDSFRLSFFVHDYYTAADLTISQSGTVLGTYTDIMSSSYLAGGSGGARNTDYYYEFAFSGVTPGQNIEVKFDHLRSLENSAWANIAFMSASVDYTAPEAITGQLITMQNTIPEPTSIALLALLGGGFWARRRIRRTTGRWQS